MAEKTGVADGYIHGFSKDEQDRLFKQARFHEDVIFSRIDFSKCKNLLEVGSGVGAQTQILLEHYPAAKIQCVDASPEQVARAKTALGEAVQSGRVAIEQADALHLPFPGQSFDGAFICWFLEHVQKPTDILREVHRVLRPGGLLYCNEVLNSTFFVHPKSPATIEYWRQFNEEQEAFRGDPYIGAKLANQLLHAGFQNVTNEVLTHYYDARNPKKRVAFIDYWTELLLSGAPSLVRSGRVTEDIVRGVRAEAERLKAQEDSVIFYSWILARAESTQ